MNQETNEKINNAITSKLLKVIFWGLALLIAFGAIYALFHALIAFASLAVFVYFFIASLGGESA